MRSNLSVINVYKKKSIKSKLLVTQLLYGDSFKIIKKKGSWIKIKNNLDGYKGFIKKRNFPSDKKNTHKIYNLYANDGGDCRKARNIKGHSHYVMTKGHDHDIMTATS